MGGERGRASIYLLLLMSGLVLGAVVGGEIMRRLYAPRSTAEAAEARRNSRLESEGAHKDSHVLPQESIATSRRNAIVQAAERVAPCVVGIVVTQLQYDRTLYYYDDFFNPFMPPKMVPQYREVQNMGSGFIISKDGLILTNYHVVEGALKLYVNFSDGRRLEAKVVGAHPASDIAVVRVSGESFPAVELGDSDDLLIGEWVVAIGNPFLNFFNDAHPTVTVGVLSALDRNFWPNEEGAYYQNMIQTDAAINPGNSGGPLLNAEGKVIGVNTSIYTGGTKNSGGSIGIGFAIPINRAKRVARELVAYGRKRSIWTGIAAQDLDRAIALALGYNRTQGVVVVSVEEGSPGAEAGLRKGDVIVEMGDRVIRSALDIDGLFLNYFVGDTVPMRIVRGGKQKLLSMKLKEERKR
ncbi:MAG: PDZ domain-containing protein [Chitinivibrionales bacterium]|nr:PDZ domain-containing protein [Chitinivibrionales bacterium]